MVSARSKSLFSSRSSSGRDFPSSTLIPVYVIYFTMSEMKENVEIDVETGTNKRLPPVGMPQLPKSLSLEEKKYLLAVERGDMPNVKRMLQKAHKFKTLDINCVDSLGRGALTLAIDQENLEMVELLVIMGVLTKDALLHAINAEFVEAVELLLEHEELIHKEGEPYSWQNMNINTATFTPDITPLVLAAHKNNYEILKILLDRGATLPMPHDIKCGCNDCIKESEEDSLRQALARFNEYRALASPSLIALSSSDPILTAFQLSWELRNLAFAEPESKSEYLELRRQCQQFAVDLLQQSRSSQELAIILNHDPNSPPYEEGDHMQLARLELAITYKQKKFVSHPNIQQLLAAIWYEGVPGFRRKSTSQKFLIIIKVALLFPFYCMLYMLAPQTKTGKLMRKPFMKFLIHASSYLFFLLTLILVSQRAEDHLFEYFGTESMRQMVAEKYEKQRGNLPYILEYVIFIYVIGFIYEETHEIYVEGIQSYLRDLWNFIDFSRNFLYCMVFLLRAAAYLQQTSEISRDPSTAYSRREEWQAFDPQLIAEGLFAAANIFSALKLVHLFSINPHLGPLQISLGRMVIDIVKFFFIYTLVLFAFACGLNQLLWYFADLERKKCYHFANGMPDWDGAGDACMKWRRFANVFESSQSLFWASFGMVDLSSFELTGIKTYTRFWGLLMFGSYSVINVIVLLNLLIAMMSNSYAMIDEHSDTEWKFARTKLWLKYFEEGSTLPPPFNIFPTPKILCQLCGAREKNKLRRMSTKRRNREEKERDYRYTSVMRALVWRYVTAMHKKCEDNPVTEDDINEVKGDISAFRYELLEVLQKNGMDISSAEKKEKAVLGKKMKVWERRLMKDFKVAPIATEEEMDTLIYEPPPENEDSISKFRRVAKLAVLNSNMNKWKQVVKGACIASQIGHCSSRDSFKKQQNLQKAMEQAKRIVQKSPLPTPRATSPIDLPDTTGSNIIHIIEEISEDEVTKTKTGLQPLISICPPTPSPNLKTGNTVELFEQICNKSLDMIHSNIVEATTLPNSKSPSPKSDDENDALENISTNGAAEISNVTAGTDKSLEETKPQEAKVEELGETHVEKSTTVSETTEEVEQKNTNTVSGTAPPLPSTSIFSQIDAPTVSPDVNSGGESSKTMVKEEPSIFSKENIPDSATTCNVALPLSSVFVIPEVDALMEISGEESAETKVKDEQSISSMEKLPETNADKEIKPIPVMKTNAEKKRPAPKAPDQEDEIHVTAAKLETESQIECQKSPLTARNIRRIDDKRRQPKTGWL